MNGEELTFKVNIEAGETNIGDFIDPSALSSLVQANEEVKQLTDQINALKQAQKEQGQLTAEQAQQLEELNLKLKEARSAYQNQQKDLLNLRNAQTATGKTYNELVARNKALSQIMRELPIDDTTGQLQRLQEEYKANNDALKTFDASMGNHQRNVGNYKDAFEGLSGVFGMLPASMQGLSGAFAGVATAIDFADKTTKEADGGFKAFFKTLVTNPIGLIIIGVTALIGFLSKLKPVTEALEKVFAVLGSTLDTVVGYVEALINGTDRSTISFRNNARAALDALAAQKKLAAMEAQQPKIIADYNSALETQRQIFEDSDRTTQDRIRAFRQYQVLLVRQKDAEIALAEQQAETAKQNKADLKDINDALANVKNLETERRALIFDQKNALADFQAQFIKTTEVVVKGLSKELDLVKKLNQEMKDLSFTLINEYLLNQEKVRQKQIDLLEEIDTLGKKIDDNFKKRRQDLDKFNQDKDEAILNYELAQLNIRYTQREQLEIDYRKRVLELQKYYFNLGIEANYAAEMAKFEANKEFANKGIELTLGNLKFIADSAVAINNALFKESKALAIAQAIIDTLAASVSVLRSEGPLWKRIASSAVILAQGYATVQKIRSTNKGTSSTGSTSIPTPSSGAERVPMVGNAFNPGAPITMGNANLSAGMAGAMGSRDMGITVNAKVDRKGLAIAVREGEREIKTQQFTFA